MLNKTACFMAKRLLQSQIIQQDSYDVYVYGFELLLAFLLSTSLVILIGIIIKKIAETIVFLTVFIFLRSFSGGYHANKYYICIIGTICVYIAVILLASFLHVNTVMYGFLVVIGFVMLYILAPVENPNKKITMKKKRLYKWISIALFLSFAAVGILSACAFSMETNTVFFTLCADILLMLPKNKERRKNNEII